jgi:hypothetical protein
VIVGAVVIGWLASLGASMVSDFEAPATLNALFLALAGSALAINGNHHAPGPPPEPPKELTPPNHKKRKKDDDAD